MNGVAALTLPDVDEDWSSWLDGRCQGQLAEARRLVDEMNTHPAAGSTDILCRWNDVNVALSNAASVASLIAQVHPDDAVRAKAEVAEQEADRFATDLSLDKDLYDVLSAIDTTALGADARRVVDHALRDFRRGGVDRDDGTRERLRAIADRETELQQEFSRNIREDVRSISVHRNQLQGLPADFVEAHPASEDGRHTITTDYPDVRPFLTFAEDAQARREIHVQFLSRAWPANEVILQELLALRAEHAALLSHRDWADYDAEIKMIGSGSAIADFIERITQAAERSGYRDRDILLERMRQDQPDATAIDRADSTYYAELVRRERFDVDAQEVRTYLDFAKVRQGLLDVTGRLFGVSYAHVDAPVWHSDVTAYDVHLEGDLLGRIFLDLHPREGKFKHAAQFTLVSGVAGRQLPEGALVCNFPRGLMEHSDVVTLFHEFGHLLHHILAGRHQWVTFSGVATEWDFVEAPSQLLEEWAWHADVVRTFATNAAGEPIPAELVAKMRAAHEFGKGYLARTQMFYAAVSYQVHTRTFDDLTEAERELQSTYDVFPFVEGTHFHASFGHLGGYTSAYYTYMWSLVIAKDLLSAFDAGDPFDVAIATRYRETILAAGGSRDAADLVQDFLGRPYNFEAFTRWLDGEA
ncbi:MAG: Zn-dependent oligopeptidase [Nocardioidaceae bacterium]|nr:Zn-dependent oligopeptidase [Nocardioidaceae bacterium]